MVTGVAAGSATISAASEGKSATATITVKQDTPVVPVASVSVASAPDTDRSVGSNRDESDDA